MRIADSEGTPISAVYLALSEREADELIDALRELRSARKGWHVHVSDFEHQREVTVYREDDETILI